MRTRGICEFCDRVRAFSVRLFLRMWIGRFLKGYLDALLERRGQMRTSLADPGAVRKSLACLFPRDVGHRLVRLGGDHDGGYLVPDDLDGLSACFSPGVSDVADFERDLAQRLGIRCFLADASVEGPPVDDPHFTFVRKFLGTSTGPQTMRLSDWVTSQVAAADYDLLLQMDIEGAELDVILDTPADVLRRFRIIVVELHQMHEVFTVNGNRIYERFLHHLTRDHTPVHLHPNNCCGVETHFGISIPRVLELSLLRNDRFTWDRPTKSPTHPLDRRNVASSPDLTLSDVFFDAA